MTDTESAINYTRYAAALPVANAANKGAVFDALASAGISKLVVEFEGLGDCAQITKILTHVGGDLVDLPDIPVVVAEPVWPAGDIASSTGTLSEALEILCFGYIEHEYGGSANNEGSAGTFRFDVEKRVIELEFEAWFAESISYSQEF